MKVKIIDYDFKGRGLAKTDQGLVFVDKAVIGDLLEVIVTKKTKKYANAKIAKIIDPSEDRVEAKCPYFKKCGGCDFLNYDYKKQIEWKKDKLIQDLKRIAAISKIDKKLDKSIYMDQGYKYRNNIQLKVRENKIGYFSKDSNEFVPIKTCLLAEDPINQAIKALNEINNFYNITDLVIRSNYKGELMVILIADGKIKNTNTILNKLLDLKLVSLYENINTNKRFRYGKNFRKIYGQDKIVDKINDLEFEISPQSFFQINRQQTEKLYNLAIDYLDPKEEDKILDLYCGVGSISLSAAEKSGEVLGVEILEEAIKNARKNAIINKIENANFVAEKSENIIEKISEKYQGINKIILDPPRSGLHKDLVEELLESKNIEKIVYISCNPATQARDLKKLKEKYEIENISLVDMFPNTVHVECIALIQRVKL